MLPTDFYTYAQTLSSINREIVKSTTYDTLDSETVFHILTLFSSSTHIGIDAETRGYEPYKDGLHGIGLSDAFANVYIQCTDQTLPYLHHIIDTLNGKVTWVLHNAKFDMKWVECCLGIDLINVEDTYLMHYVLDPTAKHKLASLAGEFLNRYPMDFSELVSRYSQEPLYSSKGQYYKESLVTCPTCKGSKEIRGLRRVKESKEWDILSDDVDTLWIDRNNGKELVLWQELYKGKKCNTCKGVGSLTTKESVYPIDYLPLQEIGDYCAEDCYESLKLYYLFKSLLEKHNLTNIYKLEVGVMPILKRMETRGVKIDRDKIQEVRGILQGSIDFWKGEYQLYDKKGNPDSPSQVLKALYRVGVTLESTDKASLTKAKDLHPLCEIVLEYRKAVKLLQFASELDVDYVHTSYGLTKTGRLSSNSPNLQNIPAKSEEGNLIRQCFIPREKNKAIIALDYSAFEYRIIAYLSKDPLLEQCFINNLDFHGKVTGMLFGYEWEFVDKKSTPKLALEQRTAVKSINYGLAYGMGPNKLSRMLQCSLEEAEDLMAQHRKLVPDIWDFLHSSRESAIIKGYTKTLWGRKRFYNFNSPYLRQVKDNLSYGVLEAWMKEKRVSYDDMKLLRESMNHPIQGSNADAIKQAKIEVESKVCQRYGATLLLTVHDELVLEAYEDNASQVYTACKEVMEGIIDLGTIPVIVEGSIAQSWGLAK